MDEVTKEAIRYLGYGKHAVDDKTLTLISESFRNLTETAVPKSVCRIFDLQQMTEDTFKIGTIEVKSRNLGKNLKGCEKIVLFAATLGTETDRLIARCSRMDMAKAVVLQACAAAYLEEYCDQCQEKISSEQQDNGLYLRPRFSPGYGDFDIAYQCQIMGLLDCAKQIGLTMTDSYMMTPTKSVTAIIGASRTEEKCHTKGCEACDKKDCMYRRDSV